MSIRKFPEAASHTHSLLDSAPRLEIWPVAISLLCISHLTYDYDKSFDVDTTIKSGYLPRKGSNKGKAKELRERLAEHSW